MLFTISKEESSMLIEIHMIQNHSPSNLNRDDLGAPKTCVFGGVTRARISSQCLKRSIRRDSEFQKAMENDGGVRTRRLITVLAEKAHGSSPVPEDLIERVAKAFKQGGVKVDASGGDANATNILMFLPQSTIDKMAEAVRQAHQKNETAKTLCDRFTRLLGEKAAVPDIALFGRMTELDSEGLFSSIDFHVEAALSAAHAISTHEVVNEVDYFTAVDDIPIGTGAAHVNEAMYASACFYKYFCIDWDQLVKNLDNTSLSRLTLRQFLYASALSTPSGKQNSFGAFNPPEGILVEVKTERRVPISYANAFADPVGSRSRRGVIGESTARLGQHVHEMAEGYGIKAKRLWFSPGLRHSLSHLEKPVADGNFGSLDELVSSVMKTVEAFAETAGSAP